MSFNRDNFERLGINNGKFDMKKVMDYVLSDHDSEDLEIDQRDTNLDEIKIHKSKI